MILSYPYLPCSCILPSSVKCNQFSSVVLTDKGSPNCPLVRRERTITGTLARSRREGKVDLGTLGGFLFFAHHVTL